MSASVPRSSRVLLWGLLGLSNALWGASWVVAKVALRELTPLQISAWRMILAGLVLLPVAVYYARRADLPRGLWPRLALLGLAQAVAAKWCSLWGVQHSTAANAGLLMALEPGFTVALAALVLSERLSAARLTSLALGAAGAYLIVFRETGWPELSGATVLGDGVFIVGLSLEAAYSVYSKPLSERHPPLAIAAASLAVALPVWIPVAAADAAVHGWPAFGVTGWLAIVYFALGCTVFGYVVWVFALRRIAAGAVALSVFVQPLVGTLAAVLVLGEHLTARTLGGAALVLASLGLIVATPDPAAKPAAPASIAGD
jgi:drug/metabolite transporter (DMT)-like permease